MWALSKRAEGNDTRAERKKRPSGCFERGREVDENLSRTSTILIRGRELVATREINAVNIYVSVKRRIEPGDKGANAQGFSGAPINGGF